MLGCTDPKDTSTEYVHRLIELNKVDEFVLSGDGITIGRIETPAIVTQRNEGKRIIFYDTALNQILVADTSGNLLHSMGSVGSGPEEFRNINSFGIDADTIIVNDASLDLVKKFTFDGELIGMHEAMAKDNIWHRSNRLFAYQGHYYYGTQEADKSQPNNHWESGIIAKYKKNGELVEVFGSYHPSLIKTSRLYNYANLLQRKDGDFYTTHRTSFQIQRFSGKTGELVSSFGVKSPYFKISKERPRVTDTREVKNKMNTAFSFVDDAFVSKTYLAFHFFNFTTEYWLSRNPNEKENYFQIYDLSDNYIGDIVLPFYPLSMDDDSKIYLLEDDNPDNYTIGVYEMVL